MMLKYLYHFPTLYIEKYYHSYSDDDFGVGFNYTVRKNSCLKILVVKIVDTYNLYDPDKYGNNVMFDGFGHGTHIAGTIAEGTPDNVKILPVKISNEASISDALIINAIYYIVDDHKADVINMSFGGTGRNDAQHCI